jgi:hypothetical protein
MFAVLVINGLMAFDLQKKEHPMHFHIAQPLAVSP